MRVVSIVFVFFFTGAAAWAASDLYAEFLRRDSVRFNLQEGKVLKFLKELQYSTEKIEKLEVLEGDSFLIQDDKNIICLGDIQKRILRCKNAIGLTTVLFDGDSD